MRTKIIVMLLTLMLTTTYTSHLSMPVATIKPDAPRVSTAPDTAPTAKPVSATDYAVQTDYSGLTAYVPKTEQSRRLRPEPMPELTPSNSYGPLVPYIGARLYGKNGEIRDKSGLATITGTLVTDPVYDYIYGHTSSDGKRSVYILSDYANRDYEENEPIVHLQAACATDGSWYIPAEYETFTLRDNVIIAVRGHAGASSDVYDYSGKLLYNVQELDCADRIADGEGYNIAYQDKGDYAAVILTTGNTAYIYLPTGHVMYTSYEVARPFCDGLAAVRMDGLWGYIDTDYNYVLEPQYAWANDFIDGRAIVGKPNGVRSFVIDRTGAELFSVEGNDEVMELYNLWDGMGYELRNREDVVIQYYTLDFGSIAASVDGYNVYYMSDGWFQRNTPNGTRLIGMDGAWYDLPGVSRVERICGELVICADADYRYGVMTLTGEDVLPLSEDCYYIFKPADCDLFIAYTNDGVIAYNLDGSVIHRAENANYNTNMVTQGLLGVVARDSFYYLDQNGDIAFRVSLLSYLPD